VPLKAGTLLLIARGDRHEIRNTGEGPLRTLNLYIPPAYTEDGFLPAATVSGQLAFQLTVADLFLVFLFTTFPFAGLALATFPVVEDHGKLVAELRCQLVPQALRQGLRRNPNVSVRVNRDAILSPSTCGLSTIERFFLSALPGAADGLGRRCFRSRRLRTGRV